MSKTINPVIITFPGSNCERDVASVLKRHYDLEPHLVWHSETALPHNLSHVIIPGGFSFGDYLRAGALAAMSPIMNAVKEFAQSGMPVLGICNGFQILCEAKLLPGMLLRNHHDRFVCSWLSMTWHEGECNRPLSLPIAHRDGRYYADESVRQRLHEHHQIMLTYDQRDEHDCAVVNGSANGIAGIFGGPKNNIMGLMPHPERAIGESGAAGKYILDRFLYGAINER